MMKDFLSKPTPPCDAVRAFLIEMSTRTTPTTAQLLLTVQEKSTVGGASTSTSNQKFITESTIQKHGQVASLVVFEKDRQDMLLQKVAQKLKFIFPQESSWLGRQVVKSSSRDFRIDPSKLEASIERETAADQPKKKEVKKEVKKEKGEGKVKRKKAKAKAKDDYDDYDDDETDDDDDNEDGGAAKTPKKKKQKKGESVSSSRSTTPSSSAKKIKNSSGSSSSRMKKKKTSGGLPDVMADSITIDKIVYDCTTPLELWRLNNGEHIFLLPGVNDVSGVHVSWEFFYRFAHPNPSTASLNDNLSDFSIAFYPNPATNTVFIKQFHKLESISIYDVNGQLVLSENNVSELLDVTNLSNGIYSIKALNLEGITTTKKLVISK